ncbi:MAG TPA: hypothetical protein VGO17_13095, partial [Aurantimonas sp.]|nr:hypothetical protein [Aurantimonas sp.]
DGTVIRLRQLAGGTFNLTQAAPTGAANPAELDDANNFNDPLLISISGTINYNQPAPPLP